MSNKIDLQNYFEDTLTFTFGDQEFKVDESNRTYQTYQKKITKITAEDITDDSLVLAETFKSAFGDKYAEFKKIELPAKAYKDIAIKIMAAWSGIDEELIKKQMNSSIEGNVKTPSGSDTTK